MVGPGPLKPLILVRIQVPQLCADVDYEKKRDKKILICKIKLIK